MGLWGFAGFRAYGGVVGFRAFGGLYSRSGACGIGLRVQAGRVLRISE